MKALDFRQNFLNEFDTDTKCCSTQQIEDHDGNHVCVQCGTVIGRQYIGEERRAYNSEDIKNTKRTEQKWRSFGPRTILSETNKDSKGDMIDPKERTLYSRLSKIQKSLISSTERNLWEAKPKMKMIVSKMNIPSIIEEIAWKIYTISAKKKLTTGRSIDGFVVASLYIAIRIHGFPKILEEVCDVALTPRRTVYKSMSIIIEEVLPNLNLKYKPVSIKELIYRFGTDLKLSRNTIKAAMNTFKIISEKGMKKTGKDPKGIVAAILYLSCKKMKEKKTQNLISNMIRITEVTLRSRISEIEEILKK